MPVTQDPSRNTCPLPLLVCLALMVAMVGGGYWEAATGLTYWAWIACGLIPLAAGVALVLNNGANAFAAAVTATAVPFAVVVLGYRAAETALNRRDAANAAGPGQP
jgi:hypothetical protein